MGKPAVIKLQQELTQFYIKNTNDFIQALENNDIKKAQELNKSGLN